MSIVLVLLAVFLALFGAANLSPGTLGVGVICLSCLVGIFARMAQASAHRQEQVDKAAAEARVIAAQTSA